MCENHEKHVFPVFLMFFSIFLESKWTKNEWKSWKTRFSRVFDVFQHFLAEKAVKIEKNTKIDGFFRFFTKISHFSSKMASRPPFWCQIHPKWGSEGRFWRKPWGGTGETPILAGFSNMKLENPHKNGVPGGRFGRFGPVFGPGPQK